MRIVAIGEILWDVIDGRERLGGAPFNFAAHAAQLGAQVDFISAVAADARGRAALRQARELGLAGPYLKTVQSPPTGHVTVTLDRGQPDYIIHRPAAYDATKLAAEDLQALRAAQPDWLYFGTLFAHLPAPAAQLERLLEALPETKRFYDINLRKDSWSPDLLARLLGHAHLLKINEGEAETAVELFEGPSGGLEAFARWAAEKWRLDGVAITRGADGCALLLDGRWVECGGVQVKLADAVGAGDAFAAAFLHGLGQGWPAERVGAFANRVGALVASRPGAIPRWQAEEAWTLDARSGAC
jgi:fructokinase